MTDEKSGFARLKAEASDPADVLPEFDLGWLEATLDALYWWEMKDVQPKDAAILLCGLNPRDGTTDPTKGESHEIRMTDYVRLLDKFEDEARAIPRLRTLSEWLHIAKSANLKHHSWIDSWIASAHRSAAPDLPRSTESSRCYEQASGFKESAEHANSAMSITLVRRPAHASATQRNALAAIIQIARSHAPDPNDYLSVWAALVKLATSESRPAPLIGYADGEGILYSTDTDSCKAFTKNALRKRMTRLSRSAG